MQSSNLSGSRSSKANRFGIQWAIVAMGLGAMAWPGESRAWTGQPLAYVTSSAGISVIDTGDNKVVDTIRASSSSVAVAPDGKPRRSQRCQFKRNHQSGAGVARHRRECRRDLSERPF
jgi:DNA-binding beta-propeller fold protein YncE